MATRVLLRHPSSGLVKKGYFGFSWTYLFFGWFVPLFRGELVVALLHLVFTILTFGIWQLVTAFLFNKQFMTRQLEKGYELYDDEALMEIARIKIGISTKNQG